MNIAPSDGFVVVLIEARNDAKGDAQFWIGGAMRNAISCHYRINRHAQMTLPVRQGIPYRVVIRHNPGYDNPTRPPPRGIIATIYWVPLS